ncbi:MAG: thiamine pyrophosphate-binding protein [Acidobacteria bacterium]|nr:thiamine pyrophosphate-binding protein [Acidobacteriota bacterium]
MKVAQYIVKSFVDNEVKFVPGLLGDTVLDILDAIRDEPRLRYIAVRHEQSAAHMSDGYARASGKTGAVIAHRGPGVANMVTALGTAFKDSIPLVLISGNLEREKQGRDAWQELDAISLLKPVTKWNFQVTRAEQLPRVMRMAFHRARMGRPGPVHIDVPKDLAREEIPQVIEFFKSDGQYFSQCSPDLEAVKKAADLLLSAQRPVIVVGGRAGWSVVNPALTEVCDWMGIPVVCTASARGIVADDHPLYFGVTAAHYGDRTAEEAVRSADVILALSFDFDDVHTLDWNLITPLHKIIQVDPDPAELGRQFPVDIAVLSDPGMFMRELWCTVVGMRSRATPTARVRQLRELWHLEMKEFFDVPMDSAPVRMQRVVKDCSDLLGRDAIVCVGAGWHTSFMTKVPIYQPRHQIHAVTGLGSMGYVFPASLGAKLAHPEKKVVCLVGDGDFLMVSQDLETAVREKIPVVVAVLNDFAFGVLRVFQSAFYQGRHIGCNLSNPRFDDFARSFGAAGARVENPSEFKPALEKALKTDVPYVLDVLINPEEPYYRMKDQQEFFSLTEK